MQSLQFNALRPLAINPLSTGGFTPGKGTAPVDTFTRFREEVKKTFETKQEVEAALKEGRTNFEDCHFVSSLHTMNLSSLQFPPTVNLNRARLEEVILISDAFKEVHFISTCFNRSYLALSDFSKATFSGVEFEEARLSGVRFINATFKHTNLSRANLTQADLQGATLIKTDLSGANLKSAHLEGAKLKEVILRHADLTTVHLNPATEFEETTVSTDTPGIELFCDKLTEKQKDGLIWVDKNGKPTQPPSWLFPAPEKSIW